jgi:transmembrane sensor
MMSNEEKVRAAIAEQAGEWLVAHDEGSLDAAQTEALAAWLKTSPVHIEEFLGVSAIASDLKAVRNNPAYSLDSILERARAEDDSPIHPLWRPVIAAPVSRQPARRWIVAVITMAACSLLSLALLFIWRGGRIPDAQSPVLTELHFETRRGEQITRRLGDGSLLHLDTSSAAIIRYGATDRVVTLTSGQAAFEVAHDTSRTFRVLAGPVEIRDIGTEFAVRLDPHSTVVTVMDGQVAVGTSPMSQSRGTSADQGDLPRSVQVRADQQIRITEGEWPAEPIAVDAQRETSWLHREIVFDHERLERVAAEYNRYAPKPVEIASPALRLLEVTGVFATDDPEAFIAFLRSLKGVRVKVTAAQILVSS